MLTVILGKLGSKGDEAKKCDECGCCPCECDDTGCETAMGELISAFRAGDAKAACKAWQAVCELMPAPGEDEDEVPEAEANNGHPLHKRNRDSVYGEGDDDMNEID